MVILTMDLEKAALRTPDGERKLRLRSARKYRIMKGDEMGGTSDRRASLIVHGHEAPYEFALLISPSKFNSSSLRVVIDNKDTENHAIEIYNAQYSYNQGEAQPLVLSEGTWRSLVSDDYAAKVFLLDLPKELGAHNIREHGDGILNREAFQPKLENERYHFLIEFFINQQQYTLDATLVFKVGYGTRFGIPAMP